LKDKFSSLGGGNEIGASSYYIHLRSKKFLLDVGIRYEEKRRYPSLSELLKSETLDSFNEINGIFLSHGHYDHNGALPLLASKISSNKEIICSEYTKKFTEVQLNILKKHTGIPSYSIYEDILVDKAINMLSSYPVGEKINKNGYSFTFYRAGHIPGAVMTLLEVEDKKVLYTGDFSDMDYPLVERYSLPQIENLDLLIVNATNVFKKDSRWENTWGNGENRVKDLIKRIFLYNQLNIEVNQVNAGIELAILINNELEKSDFKRMGVTIFVDEPIYKMLEIIKDEEKREFVNIEKFVEKDILQNNGIYITLKKSARLLKVKKIQLNYSLHESYEGIKELILKLRAKKTLLVHYQEKEGNRDILIEELRANGYTNCEYVINEKEYEF
jgi:Cft2 family RNA processing exonuclease